MNFLLSIWLLDRNFFVIKIKEKFLALFNKREDICKTIANMEMFDFLIDIVPKDNYIQPYINSNDGNLNTYFDEKLNK